MIHDSVILGFIQETINYANDMHEKDNISFTIYNNHNELIICGRINDPVKKSKFENKYVITTKRLFNMTHNEIIEIIKKIRSDLLEHNEHYKRILI